MRTLLQDLQFAARLLRRSPGFAAVAVLSIGIGIGANTAIFSLMDAFVLRMLPAPDPQQLVFVERAGPRGTESDFPYDAYRLMRDHNRTLASSFAFDDTNISVTVDGQPEMSQAEFDDASFFPLLGARALAGRTFTETDDRLNAAPVLVISHAYWTRRFGRDSAVIGKKVTLKHIPFAIAGVMPPEFLGRRTAGNAPDLWIPMAWQPQLRLKDHDTIEIMARLKSGISASQAQQDLNQLYQQFLHSVPGPRPSAQSVYVAPASHGAHRTELANELRLLMWAVGLLLLIACINVANLMLARAANRQQEIALRTSLGATRWRLIRQLLTESLLIACAGGLCGLFLAWWASNLLLVVMGIPPIESKLDGPVLIFTAAVSLATGLVFGLIPAIRSSSADRGLAREMRQLTPFGVLGRRMPLGNVLVAMQIGLSLALVIGAGLLTRSLEKLLAVDLGFETNRVLVAAMAPTFLGYEGEKELRLYETLLDRFNAMPGVESATLSRFTLFVGRWVRPFSVTVRPAGTESPEAFCHPIGPRFFETMRIPRLLGREFSRGDTEKAPRVAIINEALARSQFPDVNPLGRTIRFQEGEPYTVVGVVANVKQISMREDPPRMAVYIPFTQTPQELLGQISFEIRTARPPASLAAALRQAVKSVDPDLPLIDVETQAAVIHDRMSDERSLAQFVSMFGGLALLLAAIGLYGTISYTLSRRTREIGIRMAVGAARLDVIRMVFGETFFIVLAGFAVGIPIALAGSRYIASRLFGVGAMDAITLAVAAAAMAGVAVIAALAPARRALRIEPLVALRWE